VAHSLAVCGFHAEQHVSQTGVCVCVSGKIQLHAPLGISERVVHSLYSRGTENTQHSGQRAAIAFEHRLPQNSKSRDGCAGGATTSLVATGAISPKISSGVASDGPKTSAICWLSAPNTP
jgi:hypothetical protein